MTAFRSFLICLLLVGPMASLAVVPRPATVEQVPATATALKQFEQFSQQPELTISTFNVLNLNYNVGRFEPNPKTGVREQVEPIREKDPAAREKTARTLRELNSDIILLQEVESKEDLQRFLTEYKDVLQRDYLPLLIEGNDGRGIDVAYLVRKDLGLDYEFISHRNMPWKNSLYPERHLVFSRDCTALVAHAPGKKRPLFILLNTHSKSKRTEIEADPESYQIREAQGQALAELKLKYESMFPGVPLIMGGDFNANPNSAPEYLALRKAGLKDSFNVMPKALPATHDDRVTHTFHPLDPKTKEELPAVKEQPDALLVNAAAEPLVISATVHKYYDERTGHYFGSPDHFWQRKKQPSDHRAVKGRFDMAKLLTIWNS